GMTAVTTDRSRACQMEQGGANALYSNALMAYRQAARYPAISSNSASGIGRHALESGHPGYGIRRIGLSGSKRRPRALQARLPRPRRGAPAGTRRAPAAARQGRTD